MATNTEAWAHFMSSLSAAAADLARALREQAAPEVVEPEEIQQDLGSRQRQAYQVLATVGDEGLQTADIAKAMGGYDFSNTYLTLRRLVELGLAELLPGSKPQRYRLHPKQRSSAAPYIRAAEQIAPGEWATYGDVSVAVRGDDRGARAVGRAAATLPTFPNPHRILMAGGVIPPEWHDGQGHGPEECRRLLLAEGIEFDDHGRAASAARVGWEELRDRMRTVGGPTPAASA